MIVPKATSTGMDLSNKIKYIITVQGNIGSGKSTLLNLLRDKQHELNDIFGNVFFVDEPVKEWKKEIFDEEPKSPLGLFYHGFYVIDKVKMIALRSFYFLILSLMLIAILYWQIYTNQSTEIILLYIIPLFFIGIVYNVCMIAYDWNAISRFFCMDNIYGFCFQILAFTSRLTSIIEKTKHLEISSCGIIERSMLSDKEIFFENLQCSPFEKFIYRGFFDLCCADFNRLEKVMIVMDTTVDDCYNRIKTRGVESEQSIPKDYLINIDQRHKTMYHIFEKNGGTLINVKWNTFTTPGEFESATNDLLNELRLLNLK